MMDNGTKVQVPCHALRPRSKVRPCHGDTLSICDCSLLLVFRSMILHLAQVDTQAIKAAALCCLHYTSLGLRQ